MKRLSLFGFVIPLAAASAFGLALTSAVPSTAAPAATATIHPGVQTFTNGSQCTANFVYSDGTNTYLGQAAHCAGTGGNTATNGCSSPSLPLGTPVQVTGASQPGVLAYSSWLTMQSLHETDPNVCQFNDLALIRLAAADVPNVNPSVPHWGGPVGLGTSTTSGETIYSYGNSELRLGLTQLSPKEGVSLGDGGNGWTHTVLTVTPGIPGDSGSGFMDSSGKAIGVLSTLNLLSTANPLASAGTNGVGDLSRELAYLHTHVAAFAGVNLVPGDVPFNGSQLPLG